MTPVEIIASILVAVMIVKLGVVLTNKKSWLGLMQKINKNSKLLSIIYLILAAIVFYYLIQELTILQIFAAIAFTTLLLGFGFLQYPEEFMQFVKKMYKKKITFGKIVHLIVWIILLILALREIF
mgnify:CR=1 FL=1